MVVGFRLIGMFTVVSLALIFPLFYYVPGNASTLLSFGGTTIGIIIVGYVFTPKKTKHKKASTLPDHTSSAPI